VLSFFSFVKLETRMVRGARRNNATVGGKRRRNNRKSRKNNVSMRQRSSRRNNWSTRRNNMMRRMMYGGYDSAPAPTAGNSMAPMQAQSLAQGQQFDAMHKNQHGGGALDAGPFPGAVTMPSVLPENLHASARVAPLDAAIKEISGLKDQSGGRRRRGSKKSKKASRKSKGRKGRKTYRGGAWSIGNEQSVSASGMLLPASLESKALSGMNAEWKLAENPSSFAPGYKSY
jgi:hypothetical protein